MTFGRAAWLVGVAVLVLVANVAASILYMVVYGHVIDPGHDPKYYDDHIQVAAPVLQHRGRHPAHVPGRLVGGGLVAAAPGASRRRCSSGSLTP